MAKLKRKVLYTCNRKKRQCTQCQHRYSKAEYDLDACPDCGAERRCKLNVRNPGEACRFHGGRTPKGRAHPNFKHGRHSKYLNTDVAQAYAEFLADPNLGELKGEMALNQTMLAEVLMGAEFGSYEKIAKQLKEIYQISQDALDAMRNQDSAALVQHVTLLNRKAGQALNKASSEASKRGEALKHIETHRRLAKTEQDILTANRQLLAIDAVKALMDFTIDCYQAAIVESLPKVDATRIITLASEAYHERIEKP